MLSLLALLKKQDWTFPYTMKYIHIFQDSHLNLRLEFVIQVTNGLIILAVGGKKENTNFLREENKTEKDQYKVYFPRKSLYSLKQTFFSTQFK